MDALQKTLQLALAGAAETEAFASIQNQPRARSLVGLLIAQGQSFVRARRARKHVFEYLDEQKVNAQSDDSAIWKVLSEIHPSKWEEWHVPASVREAITGIQTSLKQRTLKEIVTSSEHKQYRIGPWTRKAFLIMTGADTPCESKEPDILLTEDSWVRQRWNEMIRLLGLSQRDFPLTLETCHQLQLHPMQVSRLLWRLTKAGVRQLVHGPKNKLKHASHWFIS